MVVEDTLKIKNMPKELTPSEKEDFLKHFGATKVKVITTKTTQRAVCFARFPSPEIAREVLFRLHQTYVLKNRLSVEYADSELGLPKRVEQPSIDTNAHFNTFVTKLNAFNHSVDFHQPPPPHLKYSYPKANRPTINNIGHALATVPKFYTQVLHLMNRMNLPPPFAVVNPKLASQVSTPVAPVPKKKSSSESELESDEESRSKSPKRTLPPKKSVAVKRPKFIKPPVIPSTSGTTIDKSVVFESSDLKVPKKIEVKVSPSALEDAKQGGSVVTVIGSNDETTTSEVVFDDLSANQIPTKDLDVLPVFKNYHPGVPTCRLYIKNLAKSVEMKHLESIYGRYKVSEDFDIRLMQEGRMKGQAFVTLSSVEIAQKALKETNGYILNDKPLVVVFAKSK